MRKYFLITALSLNLFSIDFTYLNKIREECGLNTLKENISLTKSAKNHVVYLFNNNIPASHEQENKYFFSGYKPWDRALYTGYESQYVSENISYGPENLNDSIDMLMLAIYHRFGFLDFNINEIGIFKNDKTFVYNMGNSIIEKELCGSSGSTYLSICNKQVDYRKLNLFNKIEKNNPKYVIFPLKNSYENLPAFYDETPNPVPDLIVSGNPISIQFNQSLVHNVILKKFEILDEGKKLKTRLLTDSNDPNKKFKKNQFALFPLERLGWGRLYTVNIEAIVDGTLIKENFEFGTKVLNGKILIIRDYLKPVIIDSNMIFISLEPEIFGKIQSYVTDCNLKFIDYNTFQLNYSKKCFFKTGNGKTIYFRKKSF